MPALNTPEDVTKGFESAWNVHDMVALGDLFTADATLVNRFGHFVRGRDEIISLHTPIHETIYSDSTLENELIDVARIGEDVAVVHLWSRLSAGKAHPAGPHQVDTVILTVLKKHENSWRICALENVTLTNPRTGEAILRDKR